MAPALKRLLLWCGGGVLLPGIFLGVWLRMLPGSRSPLVYLVAGTFVTAAALVLAYAVLVWSSVLPGSPAASRAARRSQRWW